MQSVISSLQSVVCSLQTAVCSLQSAVCKCQTPGFVNRQIIRLIQFSCNCAFLDKEELCKKLVVLQLFCTQ